MTLPGRLKDLLRSFGVISRCYSIVLAAPFLLLAPLILSGQALFWGTPALQFVPWWSYALYSLQQGWLPLWNPLNGMGAPLLANYQSAFFYPPNLLLLAAGLVGGNAGIAMGYTLLAACHLAWAGLGMAVLLCRLRFSPLSQTIGGVVFGLSGYLVARLGFFSMVWVGAWLPWIIFFADRLASPVLQDDAVDGYVRKISVKFSPGLAGCITMQLLAGHAQLTWYSLLLAGAWVTAGALRRKSVRYLISGWLGFGLAVAIACGLAAVQLAPTFEYLRYSQRASSFAYEEAMTYSFWPWRFLTIFSPDFFGSPASGDYWGYASYWEDHFYLGMVPLLLAFSSLGLVFKKPKPLETSVYRPLLIGLWLLTILSFILALGKNTPVFPFLYWNVPTFEMFQAPTRYLFWAAFAFPLLSAVGIDRWRCPTGRGLYWFRLGTAGAFAVTLGAGLAWLLLNNIRLTFIRATALSGFWGLCFGLLTLLLPYATKKGHLRLWQAGVIVVTLFDLLLVGWGLNPGVRLDFYSTPAQVSESLRQEGSGPRVYLDAQVEYELKFHRFLRFDDFRPLEDWSGMRQTLLPDLNLLDRVALVNNFDPLVTERYQRWVAQLEQMPFESRQAWLAFSFVGFEERIDLNEYSGVRFDPVAGAQRWHWYTCGKPVNDLDEAWSELKKELDEPPRADRQVIVEMPTPAPRCSPGQAADIRLVAERPGQVSLSVDAPDSGWLELMDSWYPGWTVKVSGVKAELYPADTQFRAVFIEKGNHIVTFTYQSAGFSFGAMFSILVLLFGAVILRRR